MSAPNDGGPAFPIPGIIGADNNFIELPIQGMSLRDWFAGQALAGFCANPVGISNWSPEGISQDAYRIADAMLVERTVEDVKP